MIDPDLGSRVLAAVKACRTAALAVVANSAWLPHEDLPELGTFHSVWPSFQQTLLGEREGPRKLGSLFGQSRDALHALAFRDVPELGELIDYVAGSTQLSDLMQIRLLDGTLMADESVRTAMTHIGAAQLALSVLTRADALGVDSDKELAAIWEQRERALLARSLSAQLVVPLITTELPVDDRLDLADGVWIERMDAKLQLARAPIGSAIHAVPSPLGGAARFAVVVDGVRLDNDPQWKRYLRQGTDGLPLETVDLLCQALRIVCAAATGYSQILLRPLDWADHWKHDLPALEEVSRLRRYPERLDNYGWLRAPEPVTHAELADLPVMFAGLLQAAPRVQLAARRLSQAAMRPDDEDRTLDACIGIEALVGEGRDELTHKMSLRSATVLAGTMRPSATYALVKAVYDYRSRIVHGDKDASKKSLIALSDSEKLPAAFVAMLLLRRLLVSVLTAPWTPKSADAALLECLGAEDLPPSSEEDGGGSV